MKKPSILTLLCTLLLLAFCPKTMAIRRSQLTLADPFILLDGDTYYAYGTASDNGIICYSSTNLTSWTNCGLALNKNNTSEDHWFWAPEVYKFDDTYYMYYSANSHLYVAKADNPCGPFMQTGTYLLASILGSEECIDGSMFVDNKGVMWFYFARFTSEGEKIYVVKMKDPVTPVKGSLKKCMKVDTDWERIWPQVVEGPFVIKHDGKLYMSYSANSYESQDYAIGYATATLPNGTWKKYAGNPILRRWKGLVGVGHHSLFYDKEGKLRIVFHAHYSNESIHPRVSYIGTVEFVDGVMQIVDENPISPLAKTPAGINDNAPSYSVDWSVPYVPSARSAENYPILYTKVAPRQTWNRLDFNDCTWKSGYGPIGSADAVAPEGSAGLGTVFKDVNGGPYNV